MRCQIKTTLMLIARCSRGTDLVTFVMPDEFMKKGMKPPKFQGDTGSQVRSQVRWS
jgi:hypothetical protein